MITIKMPKPKSCKECPFSEVNVGGKSSMVCKLSNLYGDGGYYNINSETIPKGCLIGDEEIPDEHGELVEKEEIIEALSGSVLHSSDTPMHVAAEVDMIVDLVKPILKSTKEGE